MFQFSNKSNFFWHDKSFQLLWSYKDCLFVVVHYKNSQKKSWYRSTERNYRFQRFFIKKNVDKFSNIANIASPKVVLYLFYWFILFPKKIIIPMNVKKVDLVDIEPIVLGKELRVKLVEPTIISTSYLTSSNSINPPIKKMNLSVKGAELNSCINQKLEDSFELYSQEQQQS
jgi:hypothetical protein